MTMMMTRRNTHKFIFFFFFEKKLFFSLSLKLFFSHYPTVTNNETNFVSSTINNITVTIV